MKILLISLLLFISTQVSASSVITAKVLYVGSYGNGDFFINTNAVINESCSFPNGNGRIDIAATHPQVKQWLAIATTALATGKSITFATKSCFGGPGIGNATLDQSRDTFIMLTTP